MNPAVLIKEPATPYAGHNPTRSEIIIGYGVLGLGFHSGHFLAMRRIQTSTFGPAYTSVWHRNPSGEWTFYADAMPQYSCSRYFSSMLHQMVETPISLEWTTDTSFRVRVESAGLEWEISLTSDLSTRCLNAIAGLIPASIWGRAGFLRLVSRIISAVMPWGKVAFNGNAPNGQEFKVNLQRVWKIADSRASMAGLDFGKPAGVPLQMHLGDFWIPRQPLFATGKVIFDKFDPEKHIECA